MPSFQDVSVAEGILNSALHCLLILLLGRIFLFLFRNKGAPLRSAICLAAMLVLIALPFLSLSEDDGSLLPFHFSLPVTIGTAGGSVSSSVEIAPAIPESGSPREAAAHVSLIGGRYLDALFSGAGLIRLINLMGLIWGLGCLLLGLRFVYGLFMVHKMRGGSMPADDPRLSEILASAEKGFGRRIRTRILASPHIDSPMAIGFFRPIILLPQGLLARLSETDVRSILFHELSHIFHWDQITGIIQRLMTGLLWWNPLVYGLSRDFTHAREEISDTHVLLENDSEEYAECLIKLAENASCIRRLPVVIAMASPHIPLKDRVQIILSKERTMETHLKKPALLVIVLTAFLLIGGIAGTRLTFATPEETTPAAAPRFQPMPDFDMSGIKEGQRKDPKQVKIVQPSYPPEAREQGIEGTVAVEALIGIDGRITEARVIHSAHDLLDRVSLEAVRQWIYEPMEIDGKTVRSKMTVVCRFDLAENHPPVSVMSTVWEDEKERPPIRALGSIKPPKLIKIVEPLYPPDAKKEGIEGVVILEARTDKYGRVKETRILRSIPALDQAAIDAVEQWVYEPMVINGEPRGVIFTVTVRFQQDDQEKGKTTGIAGGIEGKGTGGVEGGIKGGVEGKTAGGVEGGVLAGVGGGVISDGSSKPPVRAEHDIEPPKQIKMVQPIYPPEAKEAGIEGTVILEVTTDIYGRVREVKVLRSIPELNQAAIDAVYQWVYEPMVIDGEARKSIFTVTCSFKLDEQDYAR